MIGIDDNLQWLRVREAARLLNVSESTVRRWLYHEKLEGWKVDGVLRVDRRSIETMVKTHRYVDVYKARQAYLLTRFLRRVRDFDRDG